MDNHFIHAVRLTSKAFKDSLVQRRIVLLPGHGEHPGRFVYDGEVFVFIYDIQFLCTINKSRCAKNDERAGRDGSADERRWGADRAISQSRQHPGLLVPQLTSGEISRELRSRSCNLAICALSFAWMSDELRHSAVGTDAAPPRHRCRSQCTVRCECDGAGANAEECCTSMRERAIIIAVGVLDETMLRSMMPLRRG